MSFDPTHIDFQSHTWFALVRRAEERIEMLRDKLEAPSLSDVETAVVRGQILECREFLRLAKPGKLRDVSTSLLDRGPEWAP